MKRSAISQELCRLERLLFDPAKREPALLTPEWAREMPNAPGVYGWLAGDKLVYIGETGCLKERVGDCRRTMNHTLRRNIGAWKFSSNPGYAKATSKKKFIPAIEEQLDSYMKKRSLCVLEVEFGRTEFEEYIVEKHKPKFNKKVRRGGRKAA